MPHKAFLHKKSLLDQFKDDHKHTGIIQSMRAEHTWNNPLTRRKRTKKLNGWIKSFDGKNHIRKLSRFNAVQTHRHESLDDTITFKGGAFMQNEAMSLKGFIENLTDKLVNKYGIGKDVVKNYLDLHTEEMQKLLDDKNLSLKDKVLFVRDEITDCKYEASSPKKAPKDIEDTAKYVCKFIKDNAGGINCSTKLTMVNDDEDDFYGLYDLTIGGKTYHLYAGDEDYSITDKNDVETLVEGSTDLQGAMNRDLADFCDSLQNGGTDEAKCADEKLGYEKGHKNSKGEDAPWVIRSHEDNRILASFANKKDAEEHLKRMKQYSKGESYELASKEIQVRKPNGTWQRWSVTWPEYVDTHVQDAKDQGWTEVRVVDIKRNENTEEPKKSEGLSNEQIKDAVEFSATEAGLENYINVDSDGAMSVTVSLPINSDELKKVRWVIDSNNGTITEYLDTEKNLVRDFTDDESLVSMLTLLFQTARMSVRKWFPKKSEALFNKEKLEAPVKSYIADVLSDLVVSFHWGEDGAERLVDKYNDVILTNYMDGDLSAYETAKYINGKENPNPVESKKSESRKKQESKKNEMNLELVDTIIVPKWLWDAFYFADEYGETLNDEEEEILADFKAKYADAMYYLETPEEEADFRSRNDFDNYGGPCYEIRVFKEK